MNKEQNPSLEQEAQQVRVQLREQRMKIAAQLAPLDTTRREFPSSMTLRLVLSRPTLLPRLVTWVAGARFAAMAVAALGILRMLRPPTPLAQRIAGPLRERGSPARPASSKRSVV